MRRSLRIYEGPQAAAAKETNARPLGRTERQHPPGAPSSTPGSPSPSPPPPPTGLPHAAPVVPANPRNKAPAKRSDVVRCPADKRPPLTPNHGGGRQPMCDPEGCSTVWGAVGGGGGTPTPLRRGGGGDPSPPPWLTQTQHLFRQAPSKRANTQS